MKPLPRHDAASVRQSLEQIETLLDERNWSAAYETLTAVGRDSDRWSDAPEFGYWCLLRSRSAVELGHYDEAVQYGRQAFASFQLTADNQRLGLTQSVLGRAYLGLGDSKNARIHSRDALGTYRRLGDARGMAHSHNQLARIHFVRGEYDTAVEHLTDGIDLYRAMGDTESEARLLGNLGRIHLLVGRWDDAQAVLDTALQCAEKAGNRVSMARNLLSLAFVATLRHQFKVAAENLDSALACIENAGLVRERSIFHEYSGWWHYEQRHWVQAKESFRRALNIGRKMSEQNDLISQSLRGLAECEAALGDWPQAARLAKEGLEVAIAIGERSEVGCLYRISALAAAHLEQPADADAFLTRAYECLDLVGDIYELARCDVTRAEIHRLVRPGDGDAVAEAYRCAMERLAGLKAADQLSEVRWMLVDARSRQGALDEALSLAREVIATGSLPHVGDGPNETLRALAKQCVDHAVSDANEFRLGGVPWAPRNSGMADGNALQQAVAFYRERLGASRVILVEVTADGKRSGHVLCSSGATPEFAEHVAGFAANPYQRHLPSGEACVHWSVDVVPDLAAALAGQNGQAPRAVVSVPVDLGPGSTGLLYADVIDGDDENTSAPVGFKPRDVDFAVAFAEVIGWHSTRLRSEGLFRDVQRLRDQLGRESEFPNIITKNTQFQDILSRTRLIVDADVSVLLLGETGTGKDLLAKAIHYASGRRDKRLVSVNCAALPESLLESELFGSRRGAYTGADRDKTGLFEEADGGTFFLDEIGEMPLSIQAKLLRFLESKEFMRLGDTQSRKVDVRVISATNRDLAEEIERGTFRRDLYYRLSPVTFALPPLRERPEDVPLLIDHFLVRIADETGRVVTLSPEALRVMCAYHWPGNVRELENEVRKLILLSAPGERIEVGRLSRKFFDLAEEPVVSHDQPIPDGFSLYNHVSSIEQRYIARALAESGGVKKHAARRLGIPESTLRLKLKQYDLGHSG